MKVLRWSDLKTIDKKSCLLRPVQKQDAEFKSKVAAIISQVRQSGDNALLELTKKYDGVALSNLFVTPQEFEQAYALINADALQAIKTAIANIQKFHQTQIRPNSSIETMPGIRCERRFMPIETVGLYVPGGKTPLPSTVMMLGVPSLIAGCSHKMVATPPRPDGSLDPHLLVAADLLGLKQILKVGGAQGIAALAYGTESVTKVDKIFGPGNSWVTEAKIQVSLDSEGAAVDMPAGPSEVLVLADETANASFVAADLLSQAEHGPDSQVVLVSTSQILIDKTQQELERHLAALPRQNEMRSSLSHSIFILADDIGMAMEISNQYAPEHLIIQTAGARELALKVKNAGSVFIGHYTPESAGDYASGTNHVLPTYGHAKSYSGLSVESFMKSITFQEIDKSGVENIAMAVETLAGVEGLYAHQLAMRLRRLDGGNDD